MSSHYKALIVVFTISALTLFFFRRPFASAIGVKRIDNWRNLWLALTVVAFLVTNFWIYVFISGAAIFVLSRAEPIKPAIYMLLMAVVPTLGAAIPGFAGIYKFIEINPQLVIAAVVLLPALFAVKHMKKISRTGGATDLFFILFLILQLVLATRASSFTHMLRTGIQEFLAIAPLYYVFSRYPKSFEDIRVISAAFVLPILVLSAISIPELFRNWHFYTTVTTNWFGQMPFTYTLRDGLLRAAASVFNPITWGYMAMTAIGVGFAVFNDRFSKFYRFAGIALLVVGLITSLSRGPWLGAIALVSVFALISPKFMTRSIQLGIASVVGVLLAMLTPFGNSIINMLPFLGDYQSDTISYRRQLLDAAWKVMLESPFFGSPDYLNHPALQAMRQGQGIIDIVNTYLQVGLKSGFIGLSLFVGVFASALFGLRRAMKSAATYDPTFALYCRAYFATLIGIMLTIFTTSSEGQIPMVYWSFVAMAVALTRIEQAQRTAAPVQSAAEEPVATPAFDWK